MLNISLLSNSSCPSPAPNPVVDDIVCEICQKVLNHLSPLARQRHVNECANSQEEKAKFAAKQKEWEELVDCPLCNTPLPTAIPFRNSHLKSCSAKNSVSTKDVLKLVETQKTIAASRKKQGLPHTKAPKPKKPAKKRDKMLAKSVAEEELQIATALSLSTTEEEVVNKVKPRPKKMTTAHKKGHSLLLSEKPAVMEHLQTRLFSFLTEASSLQLLEFRLKSSALTGLRKEKTVAKNSTDQVPEPVKLTKEEPNENASESHIEQCSVEEDLVTYSAIEKEELDDEVVQETIPPTKSEPSHSITPTLNPSEALSVEEGSNPVLQESREGSCKVEGSLAPPLETSFNGEAEECNSNASFQDIFDYPEDPYVPPSPIVLDTTLNRSLGQDLDNPGQKEDVDVPEEHQEAILYEGQEEVATPSFNYEPIVISPLVTTESSIETPTSSRVERRVQSIAPMVEEKKALPMESPAAEKNVATPVDTRPRVKILKTLNITPTPDYAAMSSPMLKAELDSFGVRKLSRKRAVPLLKKIYYSTHPVLEQSEIDRLAEGKDAKKHKTENAEEEDTEEDEEDMMEESFLEDSESGAISEKELKYVRDNIVKHKELYFRMLTFQLVSFEEVREVILSLNVNWSKTKIMDFLDQQHVTWQFKDRPQRRHRGGRRKWKTKK